MKYSGIKDDLEIMLKKTFKPLKDNYHLEITPCTIADRHGQILLWYLPNILRTERQVGFTIHEIIDNASADVNVEINVCRSQNVGTGIKDESEDIEELATFPRVLSNHYQRFKTWEHEYFPCLV